MSYNQCMTNLQHFYDENLFEDIFGASLQYNFDDKFTEQGDNRM